MHAGRLQSFSDGVIAILITIMVLELRVPHGISVDSLRPVLPVFLTYVLSFANLGIYWNNHHHMLHLTDRVNGAVLWANLNLLFWLSLFPFTTGWMGQNQFAKAPVVAYGVVLLLAGIAYFVLESTIVRSQGPVSRLRQAVGNDVKGKISVLVYMVGVAAAFLDRWIAIALYALVAVMWFVPDRRVERAIASSDDSPA